MKASRYSDACEGAHRGVWKGMIAEYRVQGATRPFELTMEEES
jgi:hypothetical protein